MLLTASQCNLMSMQTLFILCILLYSSNARKVKRDLNDLKNDPVLSSVFPSDVLEKRKDRSISTIDESFGRTENVFNKRQTIADFDNNLRFGNGPLGRDTFSSSITPFFPDSPDAKMYSSQPMISNPISLPEVSNMNDDMTSTEERIPAVNPALFAANYLPLPGSDGATTQQLGFQETKRTFIPHKENINQPTEVKSAIAKHSAPLQLHIHSPNNKLRGIVPHVPEYGETVESIRQMQKETAWKRNFIPYVQRPQQLAWSSPFFKMAPQTMYSNEIYKRNSIPHPPTEHRRITKRSKGAKTSSKSKSSKKKSGKRKSAKKSNTSPEKSADDTKRQYIAQPQPFMYPSQFNTYLPTLDQNTYALQQNIMQQQPYVNNYQPNRAAATQVQNLDGMITRPLISNEPCSDQYITCADFAKNNYCTDYPELMKIQCRKSCRYCIATPDQENSTSSVDHPLLKQSNVAQSVSNDTSSAAKDTKATTTHKNETLLSNNESLEGSGSGDSDSGSGSGGDNDDKVDTYVADTTQKSQSTIKKSAGKSLKNEGKNDNIMAVSQVVSSKQTQKPSKKEKLPKVDTTLSSLKNATSPKNLSSSQTPDTSSGSGMSDESGESQSGSGSDSNILGSKKSNIKIVTPSKEERNKIWQPKESPEHNLGEFSLPVKKNSIPMPSLNIANMKSTSDDSSDSGSGSGESGDESGSEASSDTEKSKGNIVVADNQKVTTAESKKNPDKAVLIQKTKPENKKLKSSKKSEKQKPSVYSVPKKEQQLTIKPQRQSKGRSSAKDSSSSAEKTKNPKKPKKTKTQKKKISKEPKKKEKINKTIKKENTTHKKDTKTRKKSEKSKKAQIPAQPALGSAYPRIDLKSIASALAHYEEAALELAGEYPNPSSNIDITEYQRSMIPHPSTRQVDNMDRYRQNIQIAKILQNERLKKNTIPDFLKVSSDAKKTEPDSESVDADNLDLVRQRFNVPGVEPTLNDYYAETGKLNPFEKKKKSVKKSRIENEKRMKKFRYFEQDPYEYLRNMAPGASMEPIEDPKARSVVPPDHSFPVMLMKVSPGEEKYLPEDASKRGKIRKLNAEGLPIEDDSQKPSPPATAPAESRHSVPEVPPPPQPMPYYPLPPQPLQSPFENVAAQNQAMLQFPPQSFVEQNSAPQVNAALVKQPPADVEQQTNHMRSKMLSAFFSVKNNIPEDAGSGGGEAIGKDSIPIDSVGSGSIDVTPSKKTISLQSLLFKDDVTKTSQPNEKAKAQESPSQQEGFSNYLQSNLAALTPENIKSGGVDTGASPSAEFTTKMSKTQETNWMRPNAESELASALPSASDTSTKLTTGNEAAALKQPLTKGLFAVEKHEQRTSVRDHVPKSPPLAESQPSLKQMKRKKDGKSSKSIKHKVINKNIFRFEVPKPPLNSPYLAMASAKDKIDKSLLTEFPKSPYTQKFLTEFPKSPYTQKSTINQSVNLPFTNQPIPLYSPYTSPLTFPNSLARMNIPQALPAASQYSWQQYLPYNQNFASNHANRQYSSVESKSSIVHNEQSSSLAANIGAAKYAVTPQKSKPSKITSQNKAQYDGWNYLIQKSDNVKPLIMTTNERDHTVSVKNNTFVDQSNTKISNAVKKNLIKQEPGLECGADWEGAAGDFGTFCYKVIKTKVTFDDALKECRRLNSDLFSVLNAYENRYLEDNIRSKFWIGYRDKGMDGNWKWTDDSKSFYTNWASSSIADSPKSHDCVYIDGDEGRWKDESCLKKRPFLCKAKIDACPGGWKRLKLNSAVGCYKLFNEPRAWEDAEMMCQQKNSHLASVTSEDEQTMVFQVHSSKSFWIGFNDRESEGDWRWTDRITSSYTNWGEKSPNNGGVSCAVMTPHGKWRDQPCNEKNIFICKRKGPRPEKNDGLDDDGVLLPVARLLTNVDTAPSHVFDELAKSGQRPVVPLHFWPMLKTAKSGMAGNRPMAAHGDVRSVPGGVALDGVHSFLDGGDFHGKCLTDPDKCTKGFAIAIQVYFADNVRKYEKPHCVVDTSGGGKGFTIFIAKNKLNYRVKLKDISWELRTDLIVERWQELVMTWHRSKGISVYVNGAFKDSESVGIQAKETNGGTARLIIGRESKDRGPYTCTKMVVASLAVFTKMLSVEDVPYAFTYGDTVAASYRWLMTGLEKGIIRGAPEIEQRQSLIDVDGGIYIDGETGWFEITDFDDLFMDPAKAKHGFAVSFKVKFDQRVREYKEPKYIIDTGGNVDGIRGVSVYILNDNLYFRVVSTPDEDTMIWKVRTPIYTVRWQQVVFTWRLDKGLWVYLDGSFRGYTKVPETLPGTSKDVAKRFYVGRKIIGTPVGGAQFAFGCLALYTRFLNKQDCENVFGGIDNPFPGIIREVWKNTPGENLKALQANPDFPNNPTTIEIIENFDSPFNVDGNYGSKLKGYFIAPETGNSTFYLSCSRSCELNFSPDEEAKNKTKIISLKKSTWHNQWNKYENQTSKEIFLVAGKYYYLEAVHKGVDASDSLSVGVRMPTGRYQRPISKENLQWRLPGNQHAGLIREVWYNIPGYTIADLTSNSNFPNRPSSTEILDKFDAPFNVDDNYGSRISGYFHAPETGDFRFYLSSDSSGELWISSDESESNLVKIISLNGWTDHNQWLKYPEQKSDKIFLASGRYYYIRVYMKADKLGDCASVAVELPSGHFEGPIKKKHLSWKISGTKDGPGPGEIIEAMPKAIGLFPLDEKSYKNEQAIGKPSLIISDVELTTGPGGLKDNAFLFKGKASSFVQIPNKKGDLDAKDSITILANIYPTGQDGPIINYKKDGWGVHLWQFSGSQLFVRFVTREGHMSTQPLGTRVLELNKWNQVGASYDKNSGVAQLWHDGKMVKSRNIGQVELLTNAPIRLGAREGDDRYFQGKISCVQIYNKALKEQQIGELRKCPKQTEGSQSQSDNDDLSMFSQGSGVQPAFEDIEALENRLGDDTEEELIVQGERNQATRCEPNPCVNNGVCIDDDKKIDGYVCSCSSDFTGKRCQVSRPAAENPVMKRTEIPKGYEEKNNVHAFSSSVEDNDGNEKNEDIPLLYQKLGCFKDDPTNHDLKRPVKLQQLTQERCAKACALDDKGFSYFGLQNGTSCYCGRNYGKYGKVSDGECNKNCEGNSDETCGGASSNNVYFFGLGTNYTIKTFTGKKLGAGTDAKIYLELIGERGSSDFRKLEDGIEKFEPGSVDTQKFVLPDLGRLKRMRILHDNTGTAPSWYLEKVEVSDENERKFEFDCNDWLSDTQSGGKLERELQARTLP